MKMHFKTLLASFLCLTLPVWGAYAAVPDFIPSFNGSSSFVPAGDVNEGGITLSDLKFIDKEPEVLSPEFLDSLLGLSAPQEDEVLQTFEDKLQDELFGAQTGKPFWLHGKVLVISGVVILLSGIAILIGILAGAGGGSGSGAGGGSGFGAPSLLQSGTGDGTGDGTGNGEEENTNNPNNPDPNNQNNPENGDGTTPPGGGTGGAGGGGTGGDGETGPGANNRSFPTNVPNNPEPGTMMLMLLGFCFPLLRKRFS